MNKRNQRRLADLIFYIVCAVNDERKVCIEPNDLELLEEMHKMIEDGKIDET